MLARAGFERHGPDSMQGWWSNVPAVQAANRRRYHAFKRSAVAITNGLVRKALTAAPRDALMLARRFPTRLRFRIYVGCTRSRRMMQLAEAFPFLASLIARQPPLAWAAEAVQLVEAGARRQERSAGLVQQPMALRKVKPGAVLVAARLFDHDCEPVENVDELIHGFLPEGMAAQRRWFLALSPAARLGGPYVQWVARTSHLLGTTTQTTLAQVSDASDWVRASYIAGMPKHVQRALGHRPDASEQHVTRQFSPDMSITTVRELSGQWHEAVALSNPRLNVNLPAPWRGPTP